jgi:hypothetical protein
LALLHLFTELFRKLLDLLALRRGMTRGVVHRTLRVAIVGWQTGAFATMDPTRRCNCGGGCPGQPLIAASLLLTRGVVHRTLRAAVVGWQTGAFATTDPTRRCNCGGGCPGQRLIAASLLFLLLVAAVAIATAWGLAPALGVVLSPFAAWAAGECQARPSIALAHLFAMLKSVNTS